MPEYEVGLRGFTNEHVEAESEEEAIRLAKEQASTGHMTISDNEVHKIDD
jgi:hypothetical protein